MRQKIIFMMFLMSLIIATGCTITGKTVNNEEYIKIPLDELSEEVKFYEYDDGGVNIKYFAVLGSDGEPRTAFDACDVCGGYKGYQQVGEDIKCRNCGRVFKIDGLGTKNKGYGCWPSYLPHEVKGNNVIIEIKDIQEGRRRFI
ncbi:MAG: hypothetical protein MAG795_01188 [Candidatus Woesearchaeota archaeon]|nr:hypothetical protein [Candidatus Woesearchaeota archaeon]